MTSIVTQAPNDSGEKTTVSWTVTNFGNAVWAGTQYWTDQVYFSPYPTFDDNSTLVGTVAHSNDQGLPDGQSYTSTLTFTLPPGIGEPRPTPRPSTSTSSPIRMAARTRAIATTTRAAATI